MMALDDVGKRSLQVLYLVDVVIDDLNPLNDAQRKVCVCVLQFLRSQLVDDPSTEFEREGIDRTLRDPYWRAA